MGSVDLSIVVAVRNQRAHNQLFLETLRSFSVLRTELIVVDNGSTDGSAELFRSAGARVLSTGGNLCYPESMNLGLTEAAGDYVGFLNNDIVVSPGWDRGLIEALVNHRLAVVSPVGIERMPTEALSRAVQERWRLVKRRTAAIDTAEDLRGALALMYGDWQQFCDGMRAAFEGRTLPGIVGSCVVMSRSFANEIGGWDPRVQAADWDLYLRLRQRAEEQGDMVAPMIAGWVYVHHYVQATRRGERAPFTCTHPRVTVQEKWGEAGIRRWFFDAPLLAPPRLSREPATYLGVRARRIRKDIRRTVGDIGMLARGFPGPEEFLAVIARERTGFCASQKPRVLYVHEFGRMGGAEVGLVRLLDAIRPAGVEPVVLWPQLDAVSSRLASSGTRVVRLRVPRWHHGLSLPLLPWLLVRLRRALPKGSVELVHANNYRSAPFAHLVARWIGVPCVSTVRETISAARVRQYGLQKLDALIAVCHAVAQNLVAGGVPHDRVATVHSGVALDRGCSAEESRAALGVAKDEVLLGIVAHILPHKGYDDLVQALGLIVRHVPRVKCLVVGEAPRKSYLAHLLRLAERLGVRDRLILAGPHENVVRFYQAMDVFVLPSHTEGLPLTVLEAMAAAKPVVATDVGGIPEAVCTGETGIVVPPRDANRLADATLAVLKTPVLARAMGEAGRKRVEATFTIGGEAEQTAKLYRRILAANPPRVS